jgi:acyl-CoA synthetase (NDP forming)
MTTPRAISRSQVARLLTPISVAVIGVSERPGTAGRNCIATLDNMGYKGDIHIVSRNLTELDGRKAVSSVADLPDGVDLAVLTVPGAGIVEAVESLAPKKLGGIMCFASGFAEMGGDGLVAINAFIIALGLTMMIEGLNLLLFDLCTYVFKR